MAPNFIRTRARGSRCRETGAEIRGSWTERSSSKRCSLFARSEGPQTSRGARALVSGLRATLEARPEAHGGSQEPQWDWGAVLHPGSKVARRPPPSRSRPSEGLQPAGRCPRGPSLNNPVPPQRSAYSLGSGPAGTTASRSFLRWGASASRTLWTNHLALHGTATATARKGSGGQQLNLPTAKAT